jgi:Uma2 family endonuclease
MSWEEFITSWPDDVRAEWVDGEVILMSPSNLSHQQLMLFLARLLAAFVEARELGQLLLPPFLMRLPTRPSGREPDLLFIAAEHADRLRETYLEGPADLAVEIVSPDSGARDRSKKLDEYEAAGIPEYWLIDPRRKEAHFYQCGEDGLYSLGPIDADGIYRSRVLPGFWLRVEWLWQRPLPPVPEITRQLGV